MRKIYKKSVDDEDDDDFYVPTFFSCIERVTQSRLCRLLERASPSVLYCVALRRPRLGNDLGAASPINNPSHGHILHSCQPVT